MCLLLKMWKKWKNMQKTFYKTTVCPNIREADCESEHDYMTSTPQAQFCLVVKETSFCRTPSRRCWLNACYSQTRPSPGALRCNLNELKSLRKAGQSSRTPEKANSPHIVSPLYHFFLFFDFFNNWILICLIYLFFKIKINFFFFFSDWSFQLYFPPKNQPFH